jgi:hypothetical protein
MDGGVAGALSTALLPGNPPVAIGGAAGLLGPLKDAGGVLGMARPVGVNPEIGTWPARLTGICEDGDAAPQLVPDSSGVPDAPAVLGTVVYEEV